MRTLLHIPVFLMVGLAAASEPSPTCPAPFTGRYVNLNHYYSFKVPTGYGAEPNSACDYDTEVKDCICWGDHGLHIELSTLAMIAVYSDFPTELWSDDEQSQPSKKKILSARIASEQSEASKSKGTFTKPEAISVNGNSGFRTTYSWRDLSTRRSMKRVTYWMTTTERDSNYPTAALRISLQAPASDFPRCVPALESLLKSFKWNPKIPE